MQRLSRHPLTPIVLLFVSFRVLALLLLRPGGFIADFSDYDFYRVWGQLTPAGYAAYDNLWTAYPPLFPALMLSIFELSARVPPWVDPRLSFHILFGLALLIFETGNLLLIYRLAGKIGGWGLGVGGWGLGIGDWGSGIGERRTANGERQTANDTSPINQSTNQPFLPSPLFYALLFTPVYTLLGWFESMPLFFMLLGLDLLLTGRERRWGWIASGLAAGLGFLVKLTPALLVPIAVRWLGAKLSLSALREEWFNPRSRGNLLRPALYSLLFAATIVGVGYPFVRANPALALSSLRVQSIRPPWESLWALLDGYFGYGLVPLDMRNLAGLDGPLWQSSLPWGAISLGFGLLYLWLYTRPYDWQQPRTPVAFAGVSVIWLFLYSKGWSPQFVVWVLAFVVLLLPNLRGVAIAVGLMASNFVESHIFLILLPDQTWLLWGTVLFRTALLLLLAADFLGQIWPQPARLTARRWIAQLSWAVLAVGLLAALMAAPTAGRAYAASRLTAHPCREAVQLLQAEAGGPERVIATEQPDVWEQFYPWLRGSYDLRIIDGYRPDVDPALVVSERLAALGEEVGAFWWLAMGDAPALAAGYLARDDVQTLEHQTVGACRLARVVQIPPRPVAIADTQGGPIRLAALHTGAARSGQALPFVIYWMAESPVERSYTVFTQLLDGAGRLIAQQDNLPVTGLAPTDSWQAGVIVRDPYRLAIPDDTPAGDYRLLVGLYTADGRLPLRLVDGSRAEFVEISIPVANP